MWNLKFLEFQNLFQDLIILEVLSTCKWGVIDMTYETKL